MEGNIRRAAVVSVADKIGCSACTLNDWVKKAEVDAARDRLRHELAGDTLECRQVGQDRQHDGGVGFWRGEGAW